MNSNPAFPLATAHFVHAEGLTKREWFAGLAMQAILSNRENFLTRQTPDGEGDFPTPKDVRDFAFMYADRMLE